MTVWASVGLVCAAVVLVRLVTRRGRRQLWWICSTVAPAAMLAGGLSLLGSRWIDQALGVPNLAILLYGLCLTVGSVCCQVFWHAVRNEVPSRRAILAHTWMAVLVGLLMVAFWWVAPIHGRDYLSVQDASLTRQLVLAVAVFFAYWAAVAVNSGVGAWQLLRSSRHHHPPGQEAALKLYIIAAAFAVTYDALFLAALHAQSQQQASVPLLVAAAKLAALLAVLAYGADSFMAFVAPVILARRRAKRLADELEPLWLRIRLLRPSVALCPAGRIASVRRTEFRVERMMTEIGDGLQLIDVRASGEDPIAAVARALIDDSSGFPASRILPPPASRQDEEALFLTLARAYAELIGRGRRPYAAATPLKPTVPARLTPPGLFGQDEPLQQEAR